MRESSRRRALGRKLRDLLERREEEGAFVKIIDVGLAFARLDLGPKASGGLGARIQTGCLAIGALTQPFEDRVEDHIVRSLPAPGSQAPGKLQRRRISRVRRCFENLARQAGEFDGAILEEKQRALDGALGEPRSLRDGALGSLVPG